MNIPTKQHPWKNIQTPVVVIRIIEVDLAKITALHFKWANAHACQVLYMIDDVFQVLKIFMHCCFESSEIR